MALASCCIKVFDNGVPSFVLLLRRCRAPPHTLYRPLLFPNCRRTLQSPTRPPFRVVGPPQALLVCDSALGELALTSSCSLCI